eukprot:jgi/Picre1/31505/NNA_006857.t1
MARFLLYSLAVFLVTSPALALDTPVGLNSITQNGRRKLNQGKGPAGGSHHGVVPCGNTTVTFEAEQLDELKSVNVEDNVYVYGLPLSKVAPPNTLYEATGILTVFSDGNETVSSMRPSIYNYFNASAASLREYYGVNPGLQGTEDQGLVPNIPLQLTDWAPKNNVSICLPEGGGECSETMLDVQTQQAFAPQAVTHFTPTKQPISVAVAYLEEFLKGKGYASEAIEETVEAVEAVEPKLREEALKNLTLSGVSILVSSGDSGASGLADPTEKETCLPKDNPLLFGTEYPSSLYSMPVWQKKFAERYLSENNASTFDGFPTKDTPGFNPNGRAFPDIAMYAAWFPIMSAANGDLSLQAGTSLAAPMAAAIFTLVNQKLLADGYKTIGYANPMIYWMGENCSDAFHDISVGNNQGDKQFGNKCLYGFPAAPGWDPATGFGSIKFDPFVACAKRYQDEVRSKAWRSFRTGA